MKRKSPKYASITPACIIPQLYPIKSKAILDHVSTQKQFEEVLKQRERAIPLIRELLNASTIVQERLLYYLDSTQIKAEEADFLRVQSYMRQRKVALALTKLADSWESYDFWKGQPSTFGQMTLEHSEDFISLLTKFILPFPSLVLESYLRPQSDSSGISTKCFSLVLKGMTKAEQTKLITELDAQAAVESNEDDRAALSFISNTLLTHFFPCQHTHINRGWEELISSSLEIAAINGKETILLSIQGSWRTAALNFVWRLYANDIMSLGRGISEVKQAVRFMSRYFPTHKICLHAALRRWSEDRLGTTEEELEAALKQMLYIGCFERNTLEQLNRALGTTLDKTGKFGNAEVVYIQMAKRDGYLRELNRHHLRVLYHRTK